ncbi:MAG TPA: HAMP domain-containing sensor histidine kinase, partial [Bdellovibrio sp.]|nr:HAMP domain-containing sensor histidine kinase [Bdellovibrio sp.]
MNIKGTKEQFLIAGTILVLGAFLFATFRIGIQESLFLHNADSEIAQTLESFKNEHRPLVEINFSDLYSGDGQQQILHPLLNLRPLRLQKENPVCGDETSSVKRNALPSQQLALDDESCSLQSFRSEKQRRTKQEMWERFISERHGLPDNFLTMPPYENGMGHSYAYLLAGSDLPPYNKAEWVRKHLSFFKISELADVLVRYQIDDPQYRIIARLNDKVLEEIIKGESLVLTNDYFLLKDQSRFGFSPLSYRVYDLPEFRKAIRGSKYELSALSDSTCLKQMGNACWTYNSKQTMAYLQRYSIVVVSLIGLIILTLLAFIVRHFYQNKLRQQKHQLALQVLSHEFRTPVSSMMLLVEQLAKKQNQWNTEDQDLLTRMSSEIFRLQRIIEVSRNYLQTESHRVHFKYVEVPSINPWISDFVEETHADVRYELLPKDRSVWVDPFWLKFVLSNLIQNAFLHGEPPVTIRLDAHGDSLKVCVEDHGDCEFGSLKEMTDAFVKSRRSQGMGLGLN